MLHHVDTAVQNDPARALMTYLLRSLSLECIDLSALLSAAA
jgi:hypothetical protein